MTPQVMGSALGTGIAGMAAVGAWKKAFAQNKTASFMLIAFVGAPLTQTIYGMIVMNKMTELAVKGSYLWGVGIFCGIAIGLSALMQGKAGAVACDAMGETGKGFLAGIYIHTGVSTRIGRGRLSRDFARMKFSFSSTGGFGRTISSSPICDLRIYFHPSSSEATFRSVLILTNPFESRTKPNSSGLRPKT